MIPYTMDFCGATLRPLHKPRVREIEDNGSEIASEIAERLSQELEDDVAVEIELLHGRMLTAEGDIIVGVRAWSLQQIRCTFGVPLIDGTLISHEMERVAQEVKGVLGVDSVSLTPADPCWFEHLIGEPVTLRLVRMYSGFPIFRNMQWFGDRPQVRDVIANKRAAVILFEVVGKPMVECAMPTSAAFCKR